MRNTESFSGYSKLEEKSFEQIVQEINNEDAKVHLVVASQIQPIAKMASAIFKQLKSGGRLFYIGSGTSGRLGVVDASECPPTFGVDFDKVIGLIAGGDGAIRKAVEKAEDNVNQASIDLKNHQCSTKDFVLGISASGKTPYVYGGLQWCVQNNINCGAFACNTNSSIGEIAHHKIEVPTGAEYITGSTRMKAGTAQKMVLNMISSSVMIKLGHVQDNIMIDMQLTNDKLIDRGTRILSAQLNLEYNQAKKLLLEAGSIRKVLKDNQN